jgi:hypothetical protein
MVTVPVAIGPTKATEENPANCMSVPIGSAFAVPGAPASKPIAKIKPTANKPIFFMHPPCAIQN